MCVINVASERRVYLTDIGNSSGFVSVLGDFYLGGAKGIIMRRYNLPQAHVVFYKASCVLSFFMFIGLLLTLGRDIENASGWYTLSINLLFIVGAFYLMTLFARVLIKASNKNWRKTK